MDHRLAFGLFASLALLSAGASCRRESRESAGPATPANSPPPAKTAYPLMWADSTGTNGGSKGGRGRRAGSGEPSELILSIRRDAGSGGAGATFRPVWFAAPDGTGGNGGGKGGRQGRSFQEPTMVFVDADDPTSHETSLRRLSLVHERSTDVGSTDESWIRTLSAGVPVVLAGVTQERVQAARDRTERLHPLMWTGAIDAMQLVFAQDGQPPTADKDAGPFPVLWTDADDARGPATITDGRDIHVVFAKKRTASLKPVMWRDSAFGGNPPIAPLRLAVEAKK